MNLKKYLGNFLKKEDITTPQLWTITDVREEMVGHGDSSEERAVMYFAEAEKGMVLNSSNITALDLAFGTDDSDTYRGRKIVVYTDPDVTFGGKRVGGLRLRAPRNQQPAQAPRPATRPAQQRAAVQRQPGQDAPDESWVPDESEIPF